MSKPANEQGCRKAFSAVYDTARIIWAEMNAEATIVPKLMSKRVFRIHRGVSESVPGPQAVPEIQDWKNYRESSAELFQRVEASASFEAFKHCVNSNLVVKDIEYLLLRNVLHYAIQEALDARQQQSLTEDAFIETLFCTEVSNNILNALFGVNWIGESLILICGRGSVEFRTPTDSDLEITINNQMALPAHIGTNVPHCTVLARSGSVGALDDYPRRISQICSRILGLFDVGHIEHCEEYIFSDHLINEAGSAKVDQTYPRRSSNPKFTISHENLEQFEKHFQALQENGWKIVLGHGDYSYLNRAYDYYQNALRFDILPTADGICREYVKAESFSEICRSLEALFGGDDQNAEIQRSIKNCASIVLNDAWIHHELFERAFTIIYTIRSRYAHGSKVSQEDIEKALRKDALVEVGGFQGFVDLVRRCILVGHLLGLEKEVFNMTLRSAMVTRAGRGEFNELIDRVVLPLESVMRPHRASATINPLHS